MESLCGKQTFIVDAPDLAARLQGYPQVMIDVGTGDGRYVQHVAHSYPERFVIGIDACREHLSQVSRKSLPNALYLIANAEALPAELSGQASHITINFPWGSLLTGLLDSSSKVIVHLRMIAQPGATLEIRLNSSALLKQGRSLEEGGLNVQQALQRNGFKLKPSLTLDANALRTYPTTWAKRLCYGRDPHVLLLRATSPDGYRVQGGSRQLAVCTY